MFDLRYWLWYCGVLSLSVSFAYLFVSLYVYWSKIWFGLHSLGYIIHVDRFSPHWSLYSLALLMTGLNESLNVRSMAKPHIGLPVVTKFFCYCVPELLVMVPSCY